MISVKSPLDSASKLASILSDQEENCWQLFENPTVKSQKHFENLTKCPKLRLGGLSALTARSLCTRLDCGANAIFSSFGSIQGVRDAVREEARKLYRKRVGDGFSLNPPFKGFGMALIWFAMDEPHLFSIIMESQTQSASYKDYIDSYVGFKAESLAAITNIFCLPKKEAEMLYYQLVLVALGLAATR